MKRDKVNNEKPFEYHTNDGVIFTCERSDFAGKPIMVKGLPLGLADSGNLNVALVAVAEMIAFHRGEVWPTLNGFSGYDCISFEEDLSDCTIEVPDDEDEEDEGTEGQDRANYTDTQDRGAYVPEERKRAPIWWRETSLSCGGIAPRQ